MEKPSNEIYESHVQVKVCGLTSVDEAVACARAGVDAIGLVFYPPSPRFVDDALAREIGESLPETVCPVGVFVDEPFAAIMKKVEKCRLGAVQLHGFEPPYLVYELIGAGIPVIKTFFTGRRPALSDLRAYPMSVCLVESGAGRHPGGNALAWNWCSVKGKLEDRPFILAGGLDPENVFDAIKEVLPDALDVSSGVESTPGRKDIEKVKAFVKAAGQLAPARKLRRIFQ